MNIYKVYIAGSFTNEQTRKSLEHMIEIARTKRTFENMLARFDLGEEQVHFFIPMEHKIEGDFKKEDGSWNLSNPEWARRVYNMDVCAIDDCDAVLAMYTGHVGTTGTAFEIGYAAAKNKLIVLYIPDWAKENNSSLMILNSSYYHLTEEGNIIRINDDYLNQFNQK